MDVNALLDSVKKTRSLAYDNALADLLGVDKAAVSNWRRGKNLPGIEACAQLADLAGLPVNRVVGVIEEARAHSSAAKAAWRRVAQAAALTIATLGALAQPATVSAGSGNLPSYTLCAIIAAALAALARAAGALRPGCAAAASRRVASHRAAGRPRRTRTVYPGAGAGCWTAATA